jgi:hypothetical protein
MHGPMYIKLVVTCISFLETDFLPRKLRVTTKMFGKERLAFMLLQILSNVNISYRRRTHKTRVKFIKHIKQSLITSDGGRDTG